MAWVYGTRRKYSVSVVGCSREMGRRVALLRSSNGDIFPVRKIIKVSRF